MTGILKDADSIIPLLRLRLADVKTVVGNMTTNNQDTRQALKAIAEETP